MGLNRKRCVTKFRDFVAECWNLGANSPAHKADYLNQHVRRLYETYLVCEKIVSPGMKVLSLGTGVGYLERVLLRKHGVAITAVDFFEDGPTRAEAEAFGFRTVSLNLLNRSTGKVYL